MAFLFDTNILSELRRKDRLDPSVSAKLSEIPHDRIHVSVISLMELEEGVLLMERRDALQGIVLRQWFITMREGIAPERILAVDEGMASVCAALHVPNRRGYSDALIAATAIVRDLTLVTRNVADFRGISALRLLDPWAEAGL